MHKKKAILCLDDDEVILETLEHQLQKHFGDTFFYEFAVDPMDALDVLDQLQEEHIPVFMVISDWLMPEMRGDEFLQVVEKRWPGVLRVLLTGKMEIDTPEIDALDLFGFIYKPWDEETLHKTVKDAWLNHKD